ncbi:MAG: transglycosylase SLT domain-containing protein [Lachnospiraceae bacterium]|nr:transglycosylase SLT domain-containing protein [Lachnospiraceae bacterium]
MIYIDGIGYVNELNTNIVSVNNTQQVKSNNFDKILEQETANLIDNKELTLEEIFREASEKYGISEEVLKAVAYTESRFNPNDTSSSGAMGIMQLMPDTAKALGVENAYDPYENIMGGAKLLKQLSDMYDGDLNMMLAGYNAGTGAVAKYGGIPPYESVNHYIAKVRDALDSGVANNIPNASYAVNSANQSEVSTNAAVNTSNSTYAADNSALSEAATALQKTDETATTNIYDYRSGNTLSNLLSYSQYELLLTFYENMLDIISKIGDNDNDNDSASSYLYNNLTYTKNTLKLFSDN